MQVKTILIPTIHKESEFATKADYARYFLINMSRQYLEDTINNIDYLVESLNEKTEILKHKKIKYFFKRREPKRIAEIKKNKESASEMIKKKEKIWQSYLDLVKVVDRPFDYNLRKIYDICEKNKWTQRAITL
jgi:hypothetical protein